MAPKPIPTKLKILRGTHKKNPSRINWDEPQPPAKPPKMPRWLDTDAKTKWREMVKQLKELDVLTIIDGDLLALYCQTWSDMLKAQESVAKTGQALVSRDSEGKPTVHANPFAIQLRHLRNTLTRLGAEFGLSPSSRTRVKVTGAQKKSAFQPRKRNA